MNKCQKTGVFKFSLILSFTLIGILSGNAQNKTTYINEVLPATKDSVTTATKVLHPEFTSVIHGSDQSPALPLDEHIYTMVTQMPLFPGGEKALLKLLLI